MANFKNNLVLILCVICVVFCVGLTAYNIATSSADGKSAYEIWLANGNAGSESEFLNWLKGATGEQGVQGEQGAAGLSIKSAVIDSNGDLIITFDDDTFISAGNVIDKSDRLNGYNKITFDNAWGINGEWYYAVSNDTEVFYFTNEISILGNASYAVYKDVEGDNEVVTKSVNLSVGENVFYVVEKCGNDSKLHIVKITRSAE